MQNWLISIFVIDACSLECDCYEIIIGLDNDLIRPQQIIYKKKSDALCWLEHRDQGPLLLTWFNLNISMDK